MRFLHLPIAGAVYVYRYAVVIARCKYRIYGYGARYGVGRAYHESKRMHHSRRATVVGVYVVDAVHVVYIKVRKFAVVVGQEVVAGVEPFGIVVGHSAAVTIIRTSFLHLPIAGAVYVYGYPIG